MLKTDVMLETSFKRDETQFTFHVEKLDDAFKGHVQPLTERKKVAKIKKIILAIADQQKNNKENNYYYGIRRVRKLGPGQYQVVLISEAKIDRDYLVDINKTVKQELKFEEIKKPPFSSFEWQWRESDRNVDLVDEEIKKAIEKAKKYFNDKFKNCNMLDVPEIPDVKWRKYSDADFDEKRAEEEFSCVSLSDTKEKLTNIKESKKAALIEIKEDHELNLAKYDDLSADQEDYDKDRLTKYVKAKQSKRDEIASQYKSANDNIDVFVAKIEKLPDRYEKSYRKIFLESEIIAGQLQIFKKQLIHALVKAAREYYVNGLRKTVGDPREKKRKRKQKIKLFKDFFGSVCDIRDGRLVELIKVKGPDLAAKSFKELEGIVNGCITNIFKANNKAALDALNTNLNELHNIYNSKLIKMPREFGYSSKTSPFSLTGELQKVPSSVTGKAKKAFSTLYNRATGHIPTFSWNECAYGLEKRFHDLRALKIAPIVGERVEKCSGKFIPPLLMVPMLDEVNDAQIIINVTKIMKKALAEGKQWVDGIENYRTYLITLKETQKMCKEAGDDVAWIGMQLAQMQFLSKKIKKNEKTALSTEQSKKVEDLRLQKKLIKTEMTDLKRKIKAHEGNEFFMEIDKLIKARIKHEYLIADVQLLSKKIEKKEKKALSSNQSKEVEDLYLKRELKETKIKDLETKIEEYEKNEFLMEIDRLLKAQKEGRDLERRLTPIEIKKHVEKIEAHATKKANELLKEMNKSEQALNESDGGGQSKEDEEKRAQMPKILAKIKERRAGIELLQEALQIIYDVPLEISENVKSVQRLTNEFELSGDFPLKEQYEKVKTKLVKINKTIKALEQTARSRKEDLVMEFKYQELDLKLTRILMSSLKETQTKIKQTREDAERYANVLRCLTDLSDIQQTFKAITELAIAGAWVDKAKEINSSMKGQALDLERLVKEKNDEEINRRLITIKQNLSNIKNAQIEATKHFELFENKFKDGIGIKPRLEPETGNASVDEDPSEDGLSPEDKKIEVSEICNTASRIAAHLEDSTLWDKNVCKKFGGGKEIIFARSQKSKAATGIAHMHKIKEFNRGYDNDPDFAHNFIKHLYVASLIAEIRGKSNKRGFLRFFKVEIRSKIVNDFYNIFMPHQGFDRKIENDIKIVADMMQKHGINENNLFAIKNKEDGKNNLQLLAEKLTSEINEKYIENISTKLRLWENTTYNQDNKIAQYDNGKCAGV